MGGDQARLRQHGVVQAHYIKSNIMSAFGGGSGAATWLSVRYYVASASDAPHN